MKNLFLLLSLFLVCSIPSGFAYDWDWPWDNQDEENHFEGDFGGGGSWSEILGFPPLNPGPLFPEDGSNPLGIDLPVPFFINLVCKTSNSPFLGFNQIVVVELTGETEYVQSTDWETEGNKLTLIESNKTMAKFKTGSSNSNYDLSTIKVTVRGGYRYTFGKLSFFVGPPKAPVFLNTNSDFKAQGVYELRTDWPKGARDFSWRVDPGHTIYGGGNLVLLNTKFIYSWDMPETFCIYVTAKNPVGEATTVYRAKLIPKNIGEPGEITEFNFGLNQLKLSPVSEEDLIQLNIYDFNGRVVYQNKQIKDYNINNLNLNAGIYIIEKINSEGVSTREKRVIKK